MCGILVCAHAIMIYFTLNNNLHVTNEKQSRYILPYYFSLLQMQEHHLRHRHQQEELHCQHLQLLSNRHCRICSPLSRTGELHLIQQARRVERCNQSVA